MINLLAWSFLFFLIVLSLFLALRKASNDGQWLTQHQRLPQIQVNGDQLLVNDLRDFRYGPNDEVISASYLNRGYSLAELEAVWLGISHFGSNGMAHVLLSFQFGDDDYLGLSIEARLEIEDREYHPLKGLLRSYTKMIVLATEQDVIGLRSHIRQEPLYLYRLNIPQLHQRALLLNFLRTAQSLHANPDFYNTLFDNCMTGLLAESHRFGNWWSWLDYRILLPGYSDALAHELSLIDNEQAIEIARQNALVDPSQTNIDDTDFSLSIRR